VGPGLADNRQVWRLRWAAPIVVPVLVVLACLGLSAADRRPQPVRDSASVSETRTGQAMASGFVGFSIEYSAIHQYLGRDPNHLNPVFSQLVDALSDGGSPVLRIGGDSTDHTWWPLPGVIEPAGVSYALTRDWLATVHRAAEKMNARLILGVNLAADSSSLAGSEARALIRGIGGQYIDALEIGNEPDGYSTFAWYRTPTRQIGFARGSGWNEAAFEQQFARWAAAVPDVPLAGPAYAYVGWMSHLGRLIASEPHLGVVTFHRYPLRGCGAQATGALAATIPHLLDANSSTGLARSVAPFVPIVHHAGLPLRIDELNSASCGGTTGVSNTFASSLWVIDTLFNMASVGVDGVNIHTLPGAAYAPFSFSLSHGIWHGTVNPLYYGLLMFSQAFPAGARLLTTTSSRSDLKVWSTVDPSGVIRTVIINEDAEPIAVRLRLPGRGGLTASAEALTAPGLTSRTGVRLGGASFAAGTTTGTLGAAQTTALSASGPGQYSETVPADSAVLITS
jgi:hypothetical protein